jgi:hypothetical protein
MLSSRAGSASKAIKNWASMIQFQKWERNWNYSVFELCPSACVSWENTFLKGERLGGRQDPLPRFRIFRRWTKFKNSVTPIVIYFERKIFLCLPTLHFSLRSSFSLNEAASDGMINDCEAVGGMMTDKGKRSTTLWEHLPRCTFVNNIIPRDDLGSNPVSRLWEASH